MDPLHKKKERKKERRKWLVVCVMRTHTHQTHRTAGDDDKANDKRKEEEIDTIYEYKGHIQI